MEDIEFLRDLANLEKDQFDLEIFKLIHKYFVEENNDIAIEIIDFCENERINIDPLPTITGFFINPFFNNDLLKWVTSLFPKEATGYYLDIINYRNDDDSLQIAEKLYTIFPNITEEEWILLAKLTEDFEDEEYENLQLREFLLGKSENYAIFPNWVIEKDKYDEDLYYPDNILNVEDAVKMILSDLEKLRIGVTQIDDNDDHIDIKEILTAQYAISTSKERILMLSNVVKIPSFDDSSILREYGPVNSSSFSSNIDETHECIKNGGCRMLLCNEYPETDIYGETIDLMSENIINTDWFTGKCNQCDKKIRDKRHCLRLPLHNGGWKGCYCSFSCLEKNINDHITALIVGRMKRQIADIGINNR